ncbi:hypothetical protein Tco_0799520 [Tanacetum coccineum]|uniref:Uncharacterized protein n=1 Tax=Tanacetum coccineum TaxID=301880 RepID=A0ABQ4ZRJ5_9ASTR
MKIMLWMALQQPQLRPQEYCWGKRETAVKSSAGYNWRPHKYHGGSKYNSGFGLGKYYPHRALKNKGIVDSGCSRHMTGNKAYLAEFQDFNGGPLPDENRMKATQGPPVRPRQSAPLPTLLQLLHMDSFGPSICTKREYDASGSTKKIESAQDCFVLPIWPSYSSTNTLALITDDKREGPREEEQVFMDDLERLKRQEKEANEEAEVLRKKFEHLVIKEGAAKPSSTNNFSTVTHKTQLKL